MNFIKTLVGMIANLSANKDDEVSKKNIIDTIDVDDDNLPTGMIEELSNGKGEDE